MEQESRRANQGVLLQTKYLIDSYLYELVNAENGIVFDSTLRSLLVSDKYVDSKFRHDIYTAKSRLSTYKTVNDAIEEIYIFFESGAVLTSSYFLDASQAEVILTHLKFPLEAWRDIAAGGAHKEFVMLCSHDGAGRLAYISRIDRYSSLGISGNILITVNMDGLFNVLQSSHWSEEGLSLLQYTISDTILGNINEQLKPVLLNSLGNGDNYFMDGSVKQLIMPIDSDINGFRYISVFPEQLFFEEYFNLRNFVVAALLLCCFLGLLVTYFFLRYNYKPFTRLLASIERERNSIVKENKNEFYTIEEAIENTNNEKLHYQMLLKDNIRKLRQDFLTSLLKGAANEIGETQLEEYGAQYDIKFPYRYFAVLLFYIQDAWAANESYTQMYIISNVAEEIIGRRNICYTVEGPMLAAIVNARDITAVYAELESDMAEIREFISSHFNFNFTAVFSSTHAGLKGISNGYYEANYTLYYAVSHSLDGNVFYTDLVDTSGVYSYTSEIENGLMLNIEQGNTDLSLRMLNEIHEDNFVRKHLSIDMAYCLIFDIMSTLVKVSDAIARKGGEAGDLSIIKHIGGEKTINDVWNELLVTVMNLCEKSKALPRQQISPLIEKIHTYVSEHFDSKDLNISALAVHFGKNPSYLATLFYEQTGVRLLDLINKTRIEHVKKLLKTDMSLNDIADRSGFFDANSLIRIFKKYEKLTPGEYRKHF